MDAELAEVLLHWTGAWRYPRLWVVLSRADSLDHSAVQRHLLEGISAPASADEVWQDLLESGEFLAANRLLGCGDFLVEARNSQERLQEELEQGRKKRVEQLREQCWLVQRRAFAVGLNEVAGSIEDVPQEGQQSVPLALKNLRRAEEQVEAAEAKAFGLATSGRLTRPKPWPFTETPHQTILSWLRGQPGAPRAFREWMPKDGDTGADHLVNALWWMWERKPAVDAETAERVTHALGQFLGYQVPLVNLHINTWCVRVSVPGLAPIWLPSFLWQPEQRLDLLIAHAMSVSEPVADLAARGPSLLLDPFEAVETPPRNLIVLPIPLLFQLIREPVEARAGMLLAALGRQVNIEQILPKEPIELGAGPSNWPESGLARRFLGHSDADDKPPLEESRCFLQRLFGYHGIRCERDSDLDRISFYAAGVPPLVLRFVRLLLGRAGRRGPSRPFLISVEAIEEVRASADWRRAVMDVLLAPIDGDPLAQTILQPFLCELQMQGLLSSLEGSVRLSQEDIARYVERSFAPKNESQQAIQASLGVLERAKLIARDRGDPLSFLMSIPIAAVLTHLMGEAPHVNEVII